VSVGVDVFVDRKSSSFNKAKSLSEAEMVENERDIQMTQMLDHLVPNQNSTIFSARERRKCVGKKLGYRKWWGGMTLN
jgi:hypothetical protein